MRCVLILTLVAFTSGLASCGRQQPRTETGTAEIVFEAAMDAIHDSIVNFNLRGARSDIRSLKATAANDSDRIYRLMADDMTCLYYLADVDSTIILARAIRDYCLRNEPSPTRNSMLRRALSGLGAVYVQYRSRPDSAIYFQREALMATSPDNISELLMCYSNLADAYKHSGDLVSSIETYRQAIHVVDSLSIEQPDSINIREYIPLYSGVAACYTDMRNFEQSATWWDRSAQLWDHMSTFDRSRYLNNRGNDYFYRKEYPEALEMFMRLDSLSASDPDLRWDRLFCHVNMADVYLKMGDTKAARPLIDETLQFFSRVQSNEAVLSYLYTQLMDLSRQEGDYATVERLLNEHPMPEGTRPDQRLLRLDFLRTYFSERADWRRALDSEVRYRELDDSIRAGNVEMSTAEIQRRYERDATVLSQRVTISQKESRLMRTYAIVAVVVMLVLLLVVIILIERAKQRADRKRFRDNTVAMRMENIRNRITPHFIYNALNHEISARANGTPTQMPILVNLLRQAQMLASDFCIPLDEELGFIDLYLTVEKQAVGDIDYRLNVGEGIDLHTVMLPSMTIQIFVENAVKHAFRLMPYDARKTLSIDVRRLSGNEATSITVTNNGLSEVPITRRDSTGTGMRVIFQTIQTLNERNRRKITISIDKHTGADDNDTDSSIYSVTLVIPDGYNYDLKS